MIWVCYESEERESCKNDYENEYWTKKKKRKIEKEMFGCNWSELRNAIVYVDHVRDRVSRGLEHEWPTSNGCERDEREKKCNLVKRILSFKLGIYNDLKVS